MKLKTIDIYTVIDADTNEMYGSYTELQDSLNSALNEARDAWNYQVRPLPSEIYPQHPVTWGMTRDQQEWEVSGQLFGEKETFYRIYHSTVSVLDEMKEAA